MPVLKSRDAMAFQLAAALERLDLDVSRLQLDPKDRRFIVNASEHLRTITALCEELAVPDGQKTAFASIQSELLQELNRVEGIGDLPTLITYHRKATQALRNMCIGVLAGKQPTGK